MSAAPNKAAGKSHQAGTFGFSEDVPCGREVVETGCFEGLATVGAAEALAGASVAEVLLSWGDNSF